MTRCLLVWLFHAACPPFRRVIQGHCLWGLWVVSATKSSVVLPIHRNSHALSATGTSPIHFLKSPFMVQSHRRPIIHRSVHIFHIHWKACLCFILAVQDAMEGCWEHDFLSNLQFQANCKGCPHCVHPGAYIVDGVTITGNDESRIFELYHSVLHGLFIGSYCPIDLKCSQHCLWSCQWPRQHHCDLIDHPCKTAWIGSLTFLTAAYSDEL